MEDTAAESAHLAVIDDTAEPDYLTVIDDTAEPDYLTVIDDTAEPDYLSDIYNTSEPDYGSARDNTGAPEYAAAADDAANNPTYHGTVEDTSESTHSNKQKENEYSELDATQVYEDIVDIAPSFNTDTQLQVVAEPQKRNMYSYTMPRLMLAAIVSLGTAVVVLAILNAIVFLFLFGMLKLMDNATKANDSNKLLVLGRVTSAKYMYNFTVNHLVTNMSYSPNILSVSNNGLLLVGTSFDITELHIFTTSDSHVTTLHVSDSELVNNAIFTPRGNIVCITKKYVIVLSITGDILTKSSDAAGELLSVSQDGDIYTSNGSNVFESTDYGMTWSVKFSSLDSNNNIQHAIKVSSDQYTDIFWTFESTSFDLLNNESTHSYMYTQLYMYTLRKSADNAVTSLTRNNITIPIHILEDFVSAYFLTFDGHSTIFMLANNYQNALMWSVNGTFNDQLQLSLYNSQDFINCLAVDSTSHTMYVAPVTGKEVSVFTLTYESS